MAQKDLLLYKNIATGDHEFIGIDVALEKGGLISVDVNRDPIAFAPAASSGMILVSDPTEPSGLKWSNPSSGGVLSHGALSNLDVDDHSQYALLTGRSGDVLNIDTINDLSNGGITINGVTLFNGNIITVGTVDGRDVSIDGTVLDSHIANTSNPHSVDYAALGEMALTNLGSYSVQGDLIYGSTSDWGVLSAGPIGSILKVTGASTISWGNVSWSELSGTQPPPAAHTHDHGTLSGREDDDHLQYALLAGRSGDTLLIDDLAEYTLDAGVNIEGVNIKDHRINILNYNDIVIGDPAYTFPNSVNTNTHNVVIGNSAGYLLSATSQRNVLIGLSTGASLINSDHSIHIGASSGARETLGSKLYITSYLYSTEIEGRENSIIYGEMSSYGNSQYLYLNSKTYIKETLYVDIIRHFNSSGKVSVQNLEFNEGDLYFNDTIGPPIRESRYLYWGNDIDGYDTYFGESDIDTFSWYLTSSEEMKLDSTSLYVDTITELTSDIGVTIEGILLKDSGITLGTGATVDTIETTLTDDDTHLPTSGAVIDAVNSAITGGMFYIGGYNASTNTPDLDVSPSGISQGDTYTITVDGNFFTEAVQAGDMLIANQDNPTALAHWTIVNKNIPPYQFTNLTDSPANYTSSGGFMVMVNSTPDGLEFIDPSGYALSNFNDDLSYESPLTKGNLTEVTSSVLTITGGTGAVIGTGTSIQVAQASTSVSGYLSSTDWDTFNNKVSFPGFSSLFTDYSFVWGTDTQIPYMNGTDAFQYSANLTFDGSTLGVTGNLGVTGSLNQLGVGTQWDINPYQKVRIGRSTDNAGFTFEVYNGDNTATLIHKLSGRGNDSYLQIGSGSVGIGTGTPASKLDVNGTISSTGVDVTGSLTLNHSNVPINFHQTDTNTWSRLVFDSTSMRIDFDVDGDGLFTPYETPISMYLGGAVKLGHAGNIKLETTSTGIEVTGTVVPTDYTNFDAKYGAGTSDLAWSGTTVNGIGTYVDANTIQAEANLTFDGSTLDVTGDMGITGILDVDAITTDNADGLRMYQQNILGGTTGNTIIVAEFQAKGGSTGNNVYHREFRLRDATGTTWDTQRIHDAISVDSSYGTPGTDTKTWWERDPKSGTQYFGNEADTYLTMSSTKATFGYDVDVTGDITADGTITAYTYLKSASSIVVLSTTTAGYIYLRPNVSSTNQTQFGSSGLTIMNKDTGAEILRLNDSGATTASDGMSYLTFSYNAGSWMGYVGFPESTNTKMFVRNSNTDADSDIIVRPVSGSVVLEYSSSTKLATTSAGAEVTGLININNSAGNYMLYLNDSGATSLENANPRIGYRSNGTDIGFVGFGDSSSRTLSLWNSINEGTNDANILLYAADGSIYLYDNGSLKLNTNSTGVDVTGDITVDGTITTDTYLKSSDSVLALGTTTAGYIHLRPNAAATTNQTTFESSGLVTINKAGGGQILLLNDSGATTPTDALSTLSFTYNAGTQAGYVGFPSADTKLYLRNNNSDADSDIIIRPETGSVKLEYSTSTKLATTSTGIDITGKVKATNDFVISGSGYGLRADTSDTADNQYVAISGGGLASSSRGGVIIISGNENSTYGGDIVINPGGGTGAAVKIDSTLTVADGGVDVTGNASIAGDVYIDDGGTNQMIRFMQSGTHRGYLGIGNPGFLFTEASTQSLSLRSQGDLHLGANGDHLQMTFDGSDVYFNNLNGASTSYTLFYDPSTEKVTYGTAPSGGTGTVGSTDYSIPYSNIAGTGFIYSDNFLYNPSLGGLKPLTNSTAYDFTVEAGDSNSSSDVGGSLYMGAGECTVTGDGGDVFIYAGNGTSGYVDGTIYIGFNGTHWTESDILVRSNSTNYALTIDNDNSGGDGLKILLDATTTANNALAIISGSTTIARIDATGDLYAGDIGFQSDPRLKDIIDEPVNGLATVLQFNVVNFNWKDKRNNYNNIGFLTTDMDKIRPELVLRGEEYDSLSYAKVSAINSAAIQDLFYIVETKEERLQKRVKELENKVKELENATTK